MDGTPVTGEEVVDASRPGGEPPALATIPFATALRRVRSLRQHTALLAHLYEVVVTRFFAEGIGNEPEYTVMLGREDVVVEGVIVEKVLLLLSDEMDRLRAEQSRLENGVVAIPGSQQATEEIVTSAETVAVDDEVVINPAAARSRPQKMKGGGAD